MQKNNQNEQIFIAVVTRILMASKISCLPVYMPCVIPNPWVQVEPINMMDFTPDCIALD